MTIAIDFDHTWTADVALWRQFASDAKKRGHDVIIVTARCGWSEDMLRHGPLDVPVLYTGGKLKRHAMEFLGIKVDIWIDDQPGTIEPCRKLPEPNVADM
jgi:predicted glycosyltransferase